MAARSRAQRSGADAAPPVAPVPPARATAAELDAVFGALAHGARRRILVILHARGGAMTAGEIADRFRHAWPTTTRHLGVLEKAGLIAVRKDGRRRHYTLTPAAVARAAAWCSWAWTPADVVRGDWRRARYAAMRNAQP